MRVIAEIARDIASDIRATLPSTEDEAAHFIAGMAWMFFIFILSLMLVSYCAIKLQGGMP